MRLNTITRWLLRHDESVYIHELSDVLEVLGHWPWATIAAFAAAGITLYVGQTQINERRRPLGRQIVSQLVAAIDEWTAAAGVALRRPGSKSRSEVIDRFRGASFELTKALLVADMACGDRALQRHLKRITSSMGEV